MDYSSSSSPKNGNHKEKSGGGGARRGKVVKLSTDPQSIAARLRRRRISDRFKILQSLVPGGSRMDTVSMLEEAIQYVKFLKSQILLHQTAMINFANDDPTVYLQTNSIQVHLQSDRNQLSFCPENNYLGTQIETLQKVGAPNSCFQGDQIVPFEASYYY